MIRDTTVPVLEVRHEAVRSMTVEELDDMLGDSETI